MTDKQIAKLNMLQTVIRALDANEILYKGIPVFVKTVNDLKGVTQEIEQAKANLQGIAGDRNELETALVNRTVTMANVLSLLAVDTNNLTMLPKARVTKSLLYRSHSSELVSIARRIHIEALAHADAVAQYGISVGAIYELETAIGCYENRIAAPHAAVAETAAANPVVHLFADADTLLNDRLDKLMSLFKIPATGFYETYFNARNIINTAPQTKTAEGKQSVDSSYTSHELKQ